MVLGLEKFCYVITDGEAMIVDMESRVWTKLFPIFYETGTGNSLVQNRLSIATHDAAVVSE